MNHLLGAYRTFSKATRYSLAFCFRNAKSWTIARLLITALTTIAGYGVVQSTGLIANTLQQKGNAQALWFPIILFSVMLMFGFLLSRAQWYVGANWTQKLRYANDREMEDHKASLDVGLTRSKRFDDLNKRIRELPYGPRTRFFFTQEMIALFATLISFATYGMALAWYRPMYAMLLVVFAAPMMWVEFRQNAWWWDLYDKLVPHYKRRGVLEMGYQNKIAFVQALMWNQASTLRKQLTRMHDDEIAQYEEIRRRALRNEFLVHLLLTGALIGVVTHAAVTTLTIGGEIGTLMIVLASAKTFSSNLEGIAAQTSEQWNTAKGVELIEEEYFGLTPLIETRDPIEPEFSGPPCIRFDRVSFTYPDRDVEVLKEVSCTFEPGTITALVGRNGQGKSTLQKLLTRTYDPTRGAIYFDDINAQNIEPKVLSESISTLTQDYIVLNRTVEEEIASSRLDRPIDYELLLQASEFASFIEVVDKEKSGFQAQIGTEFGGREFSGGEEQRLALARVKYRNAPILVLDEPDASLDAVASDEIMSRIFELRGKVTVILITQHVSRTKECDQVVVLEDGKVVEHGKPAELLAHGTHYRKLFKQDEKRIGESEVKQNGQ